MNLCSNSFSDPPVLFLSLCLRTKFGQRAPLTKLLLCDGGEIEFPENIQWGTNALLEEALSTLELSWIR